MLHLIYQYLAKPALFSLDPEQAHDMALCAAEKASSSTGLCNIVAGRCAVEDPRLAVAVCGRNFPNPIGLAAGFDKGVRAFPFLSSLGFGAIEVGTITTEQQPGNPRPRVWRVPEKNALVNALGFPSDGIQAVLPRLQKLAPLRGGKGGAILGVNIGKSKSTPLEGAEEEYRRLTSQVRQYADYIVVNVSSPNTPELRKLQEPARLSTLLTGVMEVARESGSDIPLLVKIAPDLSSQELSEVLEVVQTVGVSGIIATNTTIRRDLCPEAEGKKGGLSGEPLRQLSLQFVKDIHERTEGRLPIVGVGGIRTAAHVIEFLRAGASLVQLYTGLVYEGPLLIRTLNRGLQDFCDREGLSSLAELTPSRAHGSAA